eukprot:jgi/Psemu1/302012/fgenesh1_kg.55_\
MPSHQRVAGTTIPCSSTAGNYGTCHRFCDNIPSFQLSVLLPANLVLPRSKINNKPVQEGKELNQFIGYRVPYRGFTTTHHAAPSAMGDPSEEQELGHSGGSDSREGCWCFVLIISTGNYRAEPNRALASSNLLGTYGTCH